MYSSQSDWSRAHLIDPQRHGCNNEEQGQLENYAQAKNQLVDIIHRHAGTYTLEGLPSELLQGHQDK